MWRATRIFYNRNKNISVSSVLRRLVIIMLLAMILYLLKIYGKGDYDNISESELKYLLTDITE